ncbi:MAG: hypothetical protein R2867_11995 [Caldilineaceae bacterium]
MTTPEEQRLPTDVPATSQLFTVRIWVEPEGQCKHGWRGKVHHISSGAWRYVRNWDGLIAFFEAQLSHEDIPPE